MSKSQGSGKGSTTPTLPGWLSSALSSNLASAQGLPGLLQLFEGFPELQTGSLQSQDINSMFGTAMGGPAGYGNAHIKAGTQGLENFIGGGPGTPSAATNAGIKEFGDLQAPGIQNWASSMGLGNSGASLDALAQGQEQAIVPLLEQDQANQLAAAGQLGSIGLQQGQVGNEMFNSKLGGLESIFQNINTPQQNRFNQQMGQTGLATGFRNELLSLLGNLFGSKQNQTQSSSGFDLSSLF